MSKKFTVGIVGTGQLARMLAMAAHNLGVRVIALGDEKGCAREVCLVRDIALDDRGALELFLDEVDVLTFENENVDVSLFEDERKIFPQIFPPLRALSVAQDRLKEKRLFQDLGCQTAPFKALDDFDTFGQTVEDFGGKCILKTRRLGYDGKGQFRINPDSSLEEIWADSPKADLILEGFVDFDEEVSAIASRRKNGEIVHYPLTRNVHREGILRESYAPYDNPSLTKKAHTIMQKILEELDYVGTLAIEFFVKGDELIINEMAPRVHNSGHWSIDGSQTSQFENHIRAILNLPLGDTKSEKMVMINCIGRMPSIEQTCEWATIKRHDYDKTSQKGRKVGHLNIPAEDEDAIAQSIRWAKSLD